MGYQNFLRYGAPLARLRRAGAPLKSDEFENSYPLLYILLNGVDIDAINYATRNTTEMKAKLCYCDQIKFNEPVLKPGTPE